MRCANSSVAMASYESQASGSPTGILYKLGVLFVFSTVCGLVIAVIAILTPQNAHDVAGLDVADGGRDVSAVLRESQQRQVPVTLTEAEINQWLARVVKPRQGGRFGEHAEIKRVYVRIREGLGEAVIEREIGGRRFTVSMFFSIRQTQNNDRVSTVLYLHGGKYSRLIPGLTRGGRFGRMVMPQGFLNMVFPSFEALGEALSEELTNGFQDMVFIRLGDQRIELDPRAPRRDAEGP